MNRITKYLNSLGRATRAIILALAVLLGSAAVVQATTITTSISTVGVTASGDATVAGTLGVTGQTTLGNASSTLMTIYKGYFGTSATSTFNADGSLTLVAGLTGTTATLSGALTGTSATLSGTASTSAIKVGGGIAIPTISGMVFGYCSFATVASFNATTTQYVNCTTVPAGALLTSDRVFVQATSSLETPFLIQSASSTGVSTINLQIINTGIGTADNNLTGTSINFWALR